MSRRRRLIIRLLAGQTRLVVYEEDIFPTESTEYFDDEVGEGDLELEEQDSITCIKDMLDEPE